MAQINLKATTTTTTEREVYPIRCYVLLNMSPEYINSIAGVTGLKRVAEAWKAEDPEMRDWECFTVMESLDGGDGDGSSNNPKQ